MNRIKIIHVLLLIYILYLPVISNTNNKALVKAKNGILDLTNWDFKKNGLINLDGNWEFYWNQLLTPEDFEDSTKHSITDYFEVPGLWNKKKINGEKVSGNGYVTFKLKVILPPLSEHFAIKVGRVETAYKLWINGKLILQKGEVGKSKEEMKPHWNPTSYHFTTDKNELEIIMQVSNFYHRKGGISKHILLGKPSQITNREEGKIGYELFIFGILLVMGLYHLALFSLRIKDPSPLYFGLFCLLTGIHVLTNGEILFSRFFPNMNWELLMKLNFLGNYVRVPMFVLFFRVLFKNYFSALFTRITVYIFAILTLLIIFTPASIYSYTLILEMVAVIAICVYIIYVLFRATFKKRIEALLSMVGFVILFLAIINDFLYDLLILNTMYIAPIGIFIFIFFQSFMLSIFSARAYKKVEQLTKRLLSLDKIKNEFLSTHSYNLSGPLKILMENIGADHGFILLERDGKWIIETKKTFPDLDAVSGINIDIDFAGGKTDEPVLSEKIVKTVIKNRENLLINNPHKDNNFTNDPYIVSHKPCSVYCMPLIHRSKIKGVLYLENNCSGNEFTDEKLQILNLLSSQIATLIDNAEIFWELETLNRNLEKKVEERTQEIILQKEEILAQRDEIEDKNKILQNAYNEITLKNRDITDSINYAKRIQTSVLPPVEYVKDIVPQSFILFKPKDILSGDFYWIEKYSGKSNSKQNDSKNSEFIIAAAVDCTGHGVPGALLSIMGYNLLSNIVNEYKYTKPSDILNILQKGVRNYLRQQDNDLKSKDGMDLSLISYDKNNRKLQFAGARNKLFLIKHGELITIKGDRQSIGGHISKKYRGKSFTNYEFEICNDDLVYIFSDGYIDQFGGPNNLKFSYNAFGKLLLSIHKKSLEEQKIILNETLEDWKNSQRQIDDILVMGFKFSSVK